MNVLLLLLGTAEICLACFMYYQEFMLPEVKACREREAKRRAERLMRQAERDVRKSGPSTTSKALKKESIQKGVRASGLLFR